MKKILWLIVGIAAAFLSGMYLYEGGKLFFWYRDYRLGLLTMAAGCAVFPLFVWSMMRFYGIFSESSAWENPAPGMLPAVTVLVFGCAAAGVVLHVIRLYSPFAALLAAAGTLGAALLLAAAVFFAKNHER